MATNRGKVIVIKQDRFFQAMKKNSVTSQEVLRVINEAIAKCELALNLMGEPAANEQAPKSDGQEAFKRFMAALGDALHRAGDMVTVSDNVSWVKIEGRNGHRVYVAKGKNSVGRVDSTLPPDVVPGAMPAGRRNGRIASWLPASTEAVARAIEIIASNACKPLK